MPRLEPLTSTQYGLRNSQEFYRRIHSTHIPASAILCSYDIESLFTNIPLSETIDIICDKLFQNNRKYHNYSKHDFKSRLKLACKDPIFLFNNIPYTHLQGCSIGSACAQTLANVFLCHHEERWLSIALQNLRRVHIFGM